MMTFRMNITTSYNFKLYKAGKIYEDKSIDEETLSRWIEKGFASIEADKKPKTKDKSK